MSFEPKMIRKKDLASKLICLKKEAETQLRRDFFVFEPEVVLQRLNTIIRDISFSTHKKSLAIYVTAEAEKIFYLTIPLCEKVMINQTYNIRSLVDNKKDVQQYLVLTLNKQSSTICSGCNGKLTCMIITAATSNGYTDTTNFSTEDFLKQVDNGLSITLSTFSCPLFVIGTAEILNQYKLITKNNSHIGEFIVCGSDDISEEKIRTIIQPYIADWSKVKNKYLLQKLYDASFGRKLAVGISDVFHVANQKRGKLLIVEKSYTFPVVNDNNKEINPIKNMRPGTVFTDLVDETIEKVLENDGDVEFVEEGFLDKFMHIAFVHK
ncbi:MAG: hypothetical protein M3R72_09355 [Bacteroidota bacterium]|nr:hypothetical protein [Bacteroidota bacterium]